MVFCILYFAPSHVAFFIFHHNKYTSRYSIFLRALLLATAINSVGNKNFSIFLLNVFSVADVWASYEFFFYWSTCLETDVAQLHTLSIQLHGNYSPLLNLQNSSVHFVHRLLTFARILSKICLGQKWLSTQVRKFRARVV